MRAEAVILEGTDDEVVQYVPEPLWKRLPMAAGVLLVGGAVSTGAIFFFSRTVRRLHVLPSRIRAEPTRLMVESVLHRPVRGRELDINRVSIHKGGKNREHLFHSFLYSLVLIYPM